MKTIVAIAFLLTTACGDALDVPGLPGGFCDGLDEFCMAGESCVWLEDHFECRPQCSRACYCCIESTDSPKFFCLDQATCERGDLPQYWRWEEAGLKIPEG